MEKNTGFNHLNFDRTFRRFPRHIIPVIAIPVLFTLIWFVLPPEIVFFLVLLALSLLAWIANFGWPEALDNLIHFLQDLQSHRGG